MQLSNLVSGVVAGAVTAAKPVTLPKAFRLSEADRKHRALAIMGESGSGKTNGLVELLELGERLLVADTEPGKSGYSTIENELERRGKTELLANVLYQPLSDYRQCVAFFDDPYAFLEAEITALNPTVLVWEGFSTAQIVYIDEDILGDDLRPSSDGEDKYAYWDKVRRATTRLLDAYLNAHGREHPWHKYVTLDIEQEKDKKGNDLLSRRYMVRGQARKMFPKGFDIIVEAYIHTPDPLKPSKIEYRYRVAGDPKDVTVKNRGYNVPADGPADMRVVWQALTGQRAAGD